MPVYSVCLTVCLCVQFVLLEAAAGWVHLFVYDDCLDAATLAMKLKRTPEDPLDMQPAVLPGHRLEWTKVPQRDNSQEHRVRRGTNGTVPHSELSIQ